MFLGSMPRRPEKAAAFKQLRQHLSMLGVWLAAIRAAPYVVHLLFKDRNEELKLDF
ncbi:hypothetical protein O6H91_14G059100 [Diphasiastrum complanatum]|uniref:Uncharacterized protein n=2 Tax=Diphasiastrum complanatum TaxID=34168 RepID=A0ACC2BPZ2_DIPCM|nr:hypothetical protein O6H91_14G058800 [Diphasiastrum complanatum]KAJ7531801.1 hypothetical protein O6H91_14G059100 [Diphasiastrum complanatum]